MMPKTKTKRLHEGLLREVAPFLSKVTVRRAQRKKRGDCGVPRADLLALEGLQVLAHRT